MTRHVASDLLLVVPDEQESTRLRHLGLPAVLTCTTDADAREIRDRLSPSALNGTRTIAILHAAELEVDDTDTERSIERLHALAGALQDRLAGHVEVKLLPCPDEDRSIEDVVALVRAADPWTASVGGALPAGAFAVGVDGFLLTDIGNGERLVARHGDRLRFAPGIGWHAWDGRRWRRDESGEADRLHKDTLRAARRDAAASIDSDEPDTERSKAALATLKHLKASEHDQRVRAALNRASKESRVVVEADRLDQDRHLLNVNNGTIDLRTGELREHREGDLITRLARARYDTKADAPRWKRFVDEFTDGDTDLAAYLQRAAGYSATGHVRERRVLVLHGTGANGKSRFLEALRDVLGGYAIVGAPDLLLSSARGSQHPTEIAKLAGARFVTLVEVPRDARFDERKLKWLTGDERLTGRRMREDFFDFNPRFSIWLAVNHLPRIADDDPAAWDRLDVIPCRRQFPRGDPATDINLGDRLASERDGILRWIVDGAIAWHSHGLSTPAAVTVATRDSETASSTHARWLRERCDENPDQQATVAELYASFRTWCAEQRLTAETETAFGRWLTDRYPKRRGPRSAGAPTTYQGLRPRDTTA